MKLLPIIMAALLWNFTIIGCSSNHAHAQTEEEGEWQIYSNEFFSMEYPLNWVVGQESIQDVPDTIPNIGNALSRSIRVGLYNSETLASWECVIVQKSSVGEGMLEMFDTPEYWRDIAIYGKQFDDHYIGIVEDCVIDSISFGSYPAAMVGYVVVTDEGDTIIQKQTVVVVDMKEMYYLNNQFRYGDKGEEGLGDSILNTIRFNTTKMTTHNIRAIQSQGRELCT